MRWLALVLVIAPLLPSARASACTCNLQTDDIWLKVDAVFLGTVTDVFPISEPACTPGAPIQAYEVAFDVERIDELLGGS